MRFTFDPPETGWTCNGSASIVEDPTAPTQPNALRLAWGIGSDPRAYRDLTGLTVGQSYAVRVRCNFDGVNAPGLVSVRVLYNDGNSFDAYLNKNPLVSGWELRDIGTLVYDVPDARLQIIGTHHAGFLGVAFIDDLELVSAEEEDMSKRREIREALIARVKTVTTANSYALTLGEVVAGVVRVPDGVQAWPHVAVKHGEEIKSIQTLGRKSSVVTFFIGVFCKQTSSDEPDDQCDDACGEIEKAIERGPGDEGADGKWLGLGYVQNVFVSGVDPEELPAEIARDVRLWVMTVEVSYSHARRDP